MALTINFTLRSIEISPSLSQTFMLDASRAAEFIVAYHLDLRMHIIYGRGWGYLAAAAYIISESDISIYTVIMILTRLEDDKKETY